MKRKYFLLLLFPLLLSSCKKDWSCVCSARGVVESTIIIHDVGRMGAKNVCEGYAIQNNKKGAGQSCELK